MILLDTHVAAWLGFEPEKISRHAHSAIRRARRSDGLTISAITLWELCSLTSRGRLYLKGTMQEYVDEVTSRMAVIPITSRIAAVAAQLPPDYSYDPCDRLIGATAIAEGIYLVTKDSKMRECKQLHTIW